jgi:alcohol dehydrogenase class IV
MIVLSLSPAEEIVAVGGGSIMDCAKAIAFLAVNSGDINDYIYNKLHSENALPLVLIPTIKCNRP